MATSSLSKNMDALYQQMEVVRQSHDAKKLASIKTMTESLFDKAAAGRADTGCFDASGMLRAMPINIELQWGQTDRERAARHLAYWQELNVKYQKYSKQCAAN